MPYLFRRPLLAGVLLLTAFLAARRFVCGPPRPAPSDIAFSADGRAGVLRGRVLGPGRNRGRLTSYVIDASGWRESPWGDFIPAHGRVAVTVPGSRPPAEWGDEALFWGRLKPLRGPALPGAYDERLVLGGRRVFCRLSSRGGQSFKPLTRTSPLWWVVQARRRFARAFSRLGPESRAIVAGLVLGENPSGFAALKDDFRRSGTVHLLVASGTNVAFVLSLWWVLGRWVFFLPRRAVLVLGAPLAFFYAFLAGGDPPVLRAAVMASVGLAGLLMGRVDRPVHLIGVAALLLLAWDPDGLFHAGFQMSFAATLGLALGMPAVEVWLRRRTVVPEEGEGFREEDRFLSFRRRWSHAALAGAARLLAAGFFSQLALAPFLIFYFKRISLAGPAANMLAVPWGAVCLYLGAGLVLFDLLSLPGAGLWAALTEKAALGLWKIASLAGRPAWAEVPAPWTVAQVAVLGAAAVGVLLLVSSVRFSDAEEGGPPPLWGPVRMRILAALSLSAVLAIGLLGPRGGRPPFLLWPGNGGDAAVAGDGNGGAALVNPASAADVEHLFLPFMRSEGVRARWIVFTRPPKDGAAILDALPGAEALCAFDGGAAFPCAPRAVGRVWEASGGSWRRESPGALSFSRSGERFLFIEDPRRTPPPGPWTATSLRPKGPVRGLLKSMGSLKTERWILRGRGGVVWESSLSSGVHRPGRDGWVIRRAGAWERESPNIVKSQE